MRSHEAARARGETLGTLGRLPEDKHRNAEGGSLLLNAAGISQNGGGFGHEAHKGKIREGIQEEGVLQFSQNPAGRANHSPTLVQRGNKNELGINLGRLTES